MFFPGIAFIGYVFFVTAVGGVAVGLAPFVVLCAGILCGLAAGYLHLFTPLHALSLWLGLGCGVAAAFWSLLRRPRTDEENAHRRESLWGTALLGAVVCYFLWYFDGVRLSYYDEFFWGAFAKSFFHEGGLWTSLSALARDDMTQAYPPMPAILANLFMSQRAFREEGVALGGMMLVLAAGGVAWHYSRRQLGTGRALALAFVTACATRVIGAKCTDYYLIGYADYLQSALFTCLLLAAILETRWKRGCALLMLGLPALALCKQTGIVLCACVMAAALLRVFLTHARRWRDSLLTALCLAAPTLAAFGGWSVYTRRYITQPSGSGSLLNISAALADPLLLPSLKAYAWACVERPLLVSPGLGWLNYITGTLTFVILGLALWGLLRWRGLRFGREWGLQLLLLLLGALGWFLLHWYAGFVFFVEPDLHNAACYERYIGPNVAGAWAAFLLLFCLVCIRAKHGARWLNILLGLHVLACVVVCDIVPWERPAQLSLSPARLRMEQAAHYLQARTEPGSTIYFIPDNASTEEEWALRYLLLPQRKGTSLEVQALNVQGQPRPTFKGFAVPSKERLDALLHEKNVDYLFVFSQNALGQYANLFPDAAQAPYLVRVTKNK